MRNLCKITERCGDGNKLSSTSSTAGATVSLRMEIFDQSSRAPAFAISGTFSWVGVFVIGMVFPLMMVGDSGFWIYSSLQSAGKLGESTANILWLVEADLLDDAKLAISAWYLETSQEYLLGIRTRISLCSTKKLL